MVISKLQNSKRRFQLAGYLENQPLFLSIDDTMAEKSGRHFELCSKLYDHAAHNGSNYLNGHCMVSLLLSFPVYQEGKTFWFMGEYWVRSKEGIERLVNLIGLSYSAMALLPYCDGIFSGYRSVSAQETRYKIGQQIQTDIILCGFGKFLETIKKAISVRESVVFYYILSGGERCIGYFLF